MSIKNVLIGLVLSALILAPLMGTAVANVPGVAINAPPPPPSPNVPVQGGQGLIKVVVTHRDTLVPATHYVDHVYLYDGDKMLKDWKYTANDANPNEIFTESLVMPATADMNLRAIAHCTQHGYSAADVYVKVLPAGTTPAQMMSMDIDRAGMQVFGMADLSKAASIAPAADISAVQQLEKSEMADIQRHQQMTTQFLQSSDGQKFLGQFDYTKGKPDVNKLNAAAASSDKQGIPQAVWTDSAGNIGNGQQIIQLGKPAAKAPGQATMKPTATPMATGRAPAGGMAGMPAATVTPKPTMAPTARPMR